jgi:hypothetical protein
MERLMVRLVILLTLAATSCTSDTHLTAAIGAELAGCVSPTLVGDARAGLQSWIDNACGDIPPGTYDVSFGPDTGVRIGIRLNNEDLFGYGVTFNFVGEPHGDWRGIQTKGDVVIGGDITLTTEQLLTHDEQSHVIEAVSGHLEITGVRFWHPQKYLDTINPETGLPYARKGGDCIRLLGKNAQETTPAVTVSADIYGNYFEACDRSAIAGQRETRGVSIHDNVYGQVWDTFIDWEVTAGAASGLDIHDEVFFYAANVNGRPCISTSAQPGPIDDINIERVVGLGCGYDALNATNVEIHHSSFEQTGPGNAMTLRKDTQHVGIYNSLITATHGHAIRITSLNEVPPGDIAIENSQIESYAEPDPIGGSDNVIDATDLHSLAIVDSTIWGRGDVAIGIRGLLQPVTQLSVVQTEFVGPFEWCTKLNNVIQTILVDNTHGPDPDNWTPTPTCTGL